MRISKILARTIGRIIRADDQLSRDIERFQNILDRLIKATGIHDEDDRDTPYCFQSEIRIIVDSLKTPGSYPFASEPLQREWDRVSKNVEFFLAPQRGDDNYGRDQGFIRGLINDRGF